MALRCSLQKSATLLVVVLAFVGASAAFGQAGTMSPGPPSQVWPPPAPTGGIKNDAKSNSNLFYWDLPGGKAVKVWWKFGRGYRQPDGVVVNAYEREWYYSGNPAGESPDVFPWYTVKHEYFPTANLANPAVDEFSIGGLSDSEDKDQDGVPDVVEAAPGVAVPAPPVPAVGVTVATIKYADSVVSGMSIKRMEVTVVKQGSTVIGAEMRCTNEYYNRAETWHQHGSNPGWDYAWWSNYSSQGALDISWVALCGAERVTVLAFQGSVHVAAPSTQPTTQPVKPPSPGGGYVFGGGMKDSDNDGWPDDAENVIGTNPLNSGDTPAAGAGAGRTEGSGGWVGGDDVGWKPPDKGAADHAKAKAGFAAALEKYKPSLRVGVGGTNNLTWTFTILNHSVTASFVYGPLATAVAFVRVGIDWCMRCVLVFLIWRTLREW